ncbi:MAG: DUF2794 domain-containing protein [Hyphomicrobiales bacterium]
MDNENFLSDRGGHRSQMGGDVIRLPISRSAKNNASDSRKITNSKGFTQVTFDRRELSEILRVYGYRVSQGEWRDYAMDFQKDRAVFSIFKRASEMPVFRVEKNPKLARKQGAYAVVNASGMILKRGHELRQVLKVLESRKHLRVVD